MKRSKLSVVAVGRQKQSRKRSTHVRRAEEVPGVADLDVRVEGERRLVELDRRELVQEEVEQLEVGDHLLEARGRARPRSQPADCQHTFAPARNAASSVFIAS